MKIIGINGSPRLKGNSATLLDKALEGARAAGAQTERVDLYPLNFKGCRSCFACKRKSPFYGKGCAMKDDATEVFERMLEADGWIFSSPLYLGHSSSSMCAFLERLHFSYLHTYEGGRQRMPSLKKPYPSVFIYDLNGGPQFLEMMHLENACEYETMLFDHAFGPSRHTIITNTVQFDDYSKYYTAAVNVAAKMAWHEEHWPKDLAEVYELGRTLVTGEYAKEAEQ